MAHKWYYDGEAECKVCEKCGYVWGEKPSQKCPMKLETRDGKIYYCENCFQEGLTRKQALIDEIGNVFCSQKCRRESMALNRKKLNKTIKHTTKIEKRTWDHDDYYYVVPEFQVDLPEGTKVNITIKVEGK